MKKAGILELKEKQKECLQRFLKSHDVFGSLPTGYMENLGYMVSFQGHSILLQPKFGHDPLRFGRNLVHM